MDHKHLHNVLEVHVDGKKMEIPHDVEGLVVINLNSYMGGTNLWGIKSSVSLSGFYLKFK